MIAYRTHSRKLLLGASATTFLTLCVWIGPDRTVFFLTVIALGLGYAWLVRHHPLIAWGVLGFFEGLCGMRSSYRRRWR
jgi:hypothetical protein